MGRCCAGKPNNSCRSWGGVDLAGELANPSCTRCVDLRERLLQSMERGVDSRVAYLVPMINVRSKLLVGTSFKWDIVLCSDQDRSAPDEISISQTFFPSLRPAS